MILKNNIEICKGSIEDIPSLIPLLQELFTIEKDFIFQKEKHEEGLKLLLSHKNCLLLVAKFENEVVAMITMQTIISTASGSKSGLIEDFVVKDDFKYMGVGSYLFEYLQEYAIKKDIKRLQLVCDDYNEIAKGFYTTKQFKKSKLCAWYKYLEE